MLEVARAARGRFAWRRQLKGSRHHRVPWLETRARTRSLGQMVCACGRHRGRRRGPDRRNLGQTIQIELRGTDPQSASFISSNQTIVLGDFNQSIVFDKGRGLDRRFRDVIAAFDQTHMRSAWHAHSGEGHGVEDMPTLHWKSG